VAEQGGACDGAAFAPPTALTGGAESAPDDGFFDPTARFVGAVRDEVRPWTREAWVAPPDAASP